MNGLTINQEKQIRAQRRLREHDSVKGLRPHYEQLAKVVSQYRRAQRLAGPGAADARKELIVEIDKCLEALGL